MFNYAVRKRRHRAHRVECAPNDSPHIHQRCRPQPAARSRMSTFLLLRRQRAVHRRSDALALDLRRLVRICAALCMSSAASTYAFKTEPLSKPEFLENFTYTDDCYVSSSYVVVRRAPHAVVPLSCHGPRPSSAPLSPVHRISLPIPRLEQHIAPQRPLAPVLYHLRGRH